MTTSTLRSRFHRTRGARRWRLWIGGLLVAWTSAIVAADQASPDADFLKGLRQRGLYELAEHYCARELQQQDLSAAQKAALTEELIRTLAVHAANEEPARRAALWKRAQEVAAGYPKSAPRHCLVQMQAALAELARAELARQEADIAVASAREVALSAVRAAQRRLEAIDKELALEVPLRRRRPPRDPLALTGEELFAVQMQAQFHLATAYRTRARIYPPGDNDRIAALQSALEWCGKPLTQLAADEPLVRRIRLEQAACHRLLGQRAEAKKLLGALLVESSPEVRHGALSELARLELDAGQPRRAIATLQVVQPGVHAEVDLVRLEALLAELEKAKQVEQPEEAIQLLRDRAVSATEQILAKHGAYWGRRADQLLVAAAGDDGGGDLEIMRRQADGLAARKMYPEAMAAYDQAAQQALDGGNQQLAFQLYYKAALAARALGDKAEQASRMRDLATRLPKQPDSANVHYYAIVLTVQLARGDPQQLAAYKEMLTEHASTWPDSERWAQIRLWKGKLLQQRRQWIPAAKEFQAAADRQPTADAIRGFRVCQQEVLAAQSDADAATAARAACRWLESFIVVENRLPAAWTAAQRAAAIAASRLYLKFVPASYSRVESMLRGALKGPPAADGSTAAAIKPLLLVALAAQPAKVAEAEAMMSQWGEASPAALLETLEGLTFAMRTASPKSRQTTAKLVLNTIDRTLQQASLDDASKRRIMRTQAEALAAAGESQQALRVFQQLAAAASRDAKLQLDYARFLSELAPATEQSLQSALDQWRFIAQRSKPNSDVWYEAKYQVAFQLYRQGEKEEARKRIEYLQAVHGFSGQPQWEQRFGDLLAKCQ